MRIYDFNRFAKKGKLRKSKGQFLSATSQKTCVTKYFLTKLVTLPYTFDKATTFQRKTLRKELKNADYKLSTVKVVILKSQLRCQKKTLNFH